MRKLEEIREQCQEAVDEYKFLMSANDSSFVHYEIEQGRAELAEEILEILNGELK